MERTLHVQSRFCSMLPLPMHAGLTSDIPMAHNHGRPSWWRANRASEVGDHCRRVGEGCFRVFRARRRIVRCRGGDSWVQPAVCKRKVCMEFPRCARAPLHCVPRAATQYSRWRAWGNVVLAPLSASPKLGLPSLLMLLTCAHTRIYIYSISRCRMAHVVCWMTPNACCTPFTPRTQYVESRSARVL